MSRQRRRDRDIKLLVPKALADRQRQQRADYGLRDEALPVTSGPWQKCDGTVRLQAAQDGWHAGLRKLRGAGLGGSNPVQGQDRHYLKPGDKKKLSFAPLFGAQKKKRLVAERKDQTVTVSYK